MIKRCTIKDIANIAGVSIKTVSRVVNNEKYVKKETREKVLKILKENNYKKNIPARSLVVNKTHTLGLVIPNLENPFYSRLSRGVIRTAEENDYSVIVCESMFDIKIGEKYLGMLIERGVDGLLIGTLDLNDVLIYKLNETNIPFVVMTCKVDKPGVNYIIADDYEAGKKVVEYLINLGHTNIVFLKGPNVYSSNERFLAYKDVMRERGIAIKDYFITKNVLNKENAYEVTLALLRSHRDVTAIIANNDYAALGALKAIKQLGLSIPNDISIIGYDDIDIAELLEVPLTTIHYPKYETGVIATQRLINILNGKKYRSKKIILKTKFIERKSCGPAKSK